MTMGDKFGTVMRDDMKIYLRGKDDGGMSQVK